MEYVNPEKAIFIFPPTDNKNPLTIGDWTQYKIANTPTYTI